MMTKWVRVSGSMPVKFMKVGIDFVSGSVHGELAGLSEKELRDNFAAEGKTPDEVEKAIAEAWKNEG
jgi:hypothetical protein